MSSITIRATCDAATAAHFGVSMGLNWVRVSLVSPPRPDWELFVATFLRIASDMVTASSIPLSSAPPTFVVDGPDAPTVGCDLLATMHQTWSVARAGGAPPAPAPQPPAETKPVAGAAAHRPPPSPPGVPAGTFATGPVRGREGKSRPRMSAAEQKALLDQMVASTLAATARANGGGSPAPGGAQGAARVHAHLRQELGLSGATGGAAPPR